MKKISNLGKVLSREQAKQIKGGYDYGGGGTGCTKDSDCAGGTVSCPDGSTTTAVGKCYANAGTTTKTCHKVSIC